LNEVLEYHKGTVEIVHQLKPFGVIMAGSNEFDPYKD
jgi:tRNA-splicing ligase RtcB